jgi:hypothetical protein
MILFEVSSHWALFFEDGLLQKPIFRSTYMDNWVCVKKQHAGIYRKEFKRALAR